MKDYPRRHGFEKSVTFVDDENVENGKTGGTGTGPILLDFVCCNTEKREQSQLSLHQTRPQYLSNNGDCPYFPLFSYFPLFFPVITF